MGGDQISRSEIRSDGKVEVKTSMCQWKDRQGEVKKYGDADGLK